MQHFQRLDYVECSYELSPLFATSTFT